ncbi:MAG: hypothetical protein IPJ41_15335 [Phycisphaerales bacterium]|nr:hypothetical protein [Phycisphaerales bacterium]
MSSGLDDGRAARTIRNQRITIAALGGLLVVLVAGGQAERHEDGLDREARREVRVEVPSQYPQYAAGGDKIYRFGAGGEIDYIVVDFAQGTVEGIPGWAPLHIDHEISRDRMSNIVRVPRR